MRFLADMGVDIRVVEWDTFSVAMAVPSQINLAGGFIHDNGSFLV